MSPYQSNNYNHPFSIESQSQNQSMSTVLYPVVDEAVAITNQPGAKIPGIYDNRIEIPHGMSSGNPALEYLKMVDQLIVHQKIEILEACLNCETRNKYKIKNSMGQPIYSAIEDTDCCTRNMCGQMRPFDLKILDNREREVIHLYRELRCQACCCPCCLQRLEVYSPPGHLIGVVQQEWSILTPNLSVQTPGGETLFQIEGPVCTCSCCNDVDFPVYNARNGKTIGKITKQWSGLGREAFTDADHFGITFPMELDVSQKAMLLGALFLIDFMYFERKN